MGDMQVSILLYAIDIVLLSESEHDLQKHLNALDDFCTPRTGSEPSENQSPIIRRLELGVNVT